MDLLSFFRRRPRVTSAVELADFIDRNAAFLIQKGLYEYARARAGHYAKILFAEKPFQQAIEGARWRAFPLGLAMVAEIAEGQLRPAASDGEHRQIEALRALVLSVFDRYPVPEQVGSEEWSALRVDLARRLQQIGLHPPKLAMDVPEPLARSYFDLMPIHEKLRSAEFPTTRSYLRVTACNIHDELAKRLDTVAVAGALRGA
jgi:hypothetical protein